VILLLSQVANLIKCETGCP